MRRRTVMIMHVKRVTALLLVLMLITVTFIGTPFSAQALASGDYEYELTEDSSGVVITRYTGNGGTLTIPNMLDGLPVKEIGYRAFRNITSITSIILPNTVETIGWACFYGCESMASIDIPDSVKVIDQYAFGNCFSLERVVIPEGVTEISDQAFFSCTSLVEIRLPSTLTRIGAHAFENCPTLEEIIIPGSVEEIGEGAFYFCSSLKSIVLPDGMQVIGANAFSECESLTSVKIPTTVTAIGADAFKNSPLVTIYGIPGSYAETYANENGIPFASELAKGDYTYIKETDGVTITGYTGSGGNVRIPFEFEEVPVTAIDVRAFAGCSGLTGVVIPATVTEIGTEAFAGCENLPSVIIPATVTSIGDGVFSGCSSLVRVTIPDSIAKISDRTFQDCISLETIVLPNSINDIGESAFAGCSRLTQITMRGVESIGDGVFADCIGLTEITLPDNVRKISTGTFSGCTSLKNAYMPDEVTEIGDRAFMRCGKLEYVAIPNVLNSIGDEAFSGCASIEGLVLPNTVTAIGEKAFSGCSELIAIVISNRLSQLGSYTFENCTSLNDVIIPNTVSVISEGLFSGCTALSNITIPESIIAIESNAFARCTKLHELDIAESVTEIGDNAFFGCTMLQKVTISPSVTQIGISTFANCLALTIYGEGGSYAETYANANDIPFIAFGAPVRNPDNYSYRYTEDGTGIVITGYKGTDTKIEIPASFEGKPVVEITSSAFAQQYPPSELVQIILPDTIKKIGNRAFEYCKRLESIKLSASLEWVGEYTFSECYSLTSITIPHSVATIGMGAFYKCTALETVTLPDSLLQINVALFSYCSSLQRITIPASVTLIDTGAFRENKNLREVIFAGNDSLETIGREAFVGCENLESIAFPDSVTRIGYMSFMDCKSLVIVQFPTSLTVVAMQAFDGCESLVGAILPEGVTNIGMWAFRNCKSLNGLYLPNTLDFISIGAFQNCESLTEVVIPETVWYEAFADETFYGCTNLEKITIPMKISWFGTDIFTDCPKVTIYGYNNSPVQTYAKESDIPFVILDDIVTRLSDYQYRVDGGKAIITRYIGDFSNIEIPSEIDGFEVVGIGNSAFAKLWLETVIIPDTVQTIGNSAFTAPNLKSITIPNSVTEIGNMAFATCTSLTHIELPDSVNKLGESVFAFCDNLTDIKISSGLTSLPTKAFWHCISLETLELPSSITTFGESVFKDCSSLKTIDLSYVSELGFECFTRCSALQEVTFSNQLEFLRGYTFQNCTSLEKVVLPDSLIETEAGEFKGCTSLVEVVLPQSLAWLGGSAFRDCTSLTTINIPGSLEGISTSLFMGCTSLEEISLPYTTKYLYPNSFKDCTSLKRATILWSVDTVFGVPFENCPNLTIYGKTRSFIHDYADENHIPFVAIGEPAENPSDYLWKLTDDETAVIITGYIGKDVNIIIPKDIEGKSVVEIGDRTFASKKLISVIIPDTVEKIGVRAFEHCKQLTYIEFPDFIREISDFALYDCISLKSIVLPDSIQIIGKSAIQSCESLEEIKLPSTLLEIPPGMLALCESLKEIQIPETVTNIGLDAFSSCKSVTKIVIPDSVTSIERGVFQRCEKLTVIEVGGKNPSYTSVDGVLLSKDRSILYVYPAGKAGGYAVPGYITKIMDDAFFSCNNLASLVLHKYLDIAPDAYDIGITFELCENLQEVIVMNPVQTFGYNAFGRCPEDFVLYGLKGSAAQNYALENGVTFKPLVMMKNAVITGNVDVIVYDTTGNTSSIKPTVSADGTQIISTLPDGYIIEFLGKGSGKMTYTVQGAWDKTGEVIEQKSFTNIPLAVGKIYSSEIVDIPDIQLFEMVDGKPVKEIGIDGAETEIQQIQANTIIMRLNSSQAFLNRKAIAVDTVTDTVSPFTLYGKTMVPVRFVENLGAKVEYKSATEPVIVTYGNIRLTVVFGSTTMSREIYDYGYYDQNTITLPTAPTLVEGKTYVPIREIAEGLGFTVNYNSETYVIVVSTEKLTSTSLTNSFAFGKGELPTEVIGVKSISLKTKEITLKVGEVYRFDPSEVVFDPVNPGCRRLIYSSSLNQVATVTSQGRIVAYEKGTAEITVSSHNGKTDILRITVK